VVHVIRCLLHAKLVAQQWEATRETGLSYECW
jgi:hypothetical protein